MRRSSGIPGAKNPTVATPEQLANVGCLVRAVGGNTKISCRITAKEHRRFMQSYGNILKVSLDSLKKRFPECYWSFTLPAEKLPYRG